MFQSNNDFRDSLKQSPLELHNNLENVDAFLFALPQVTLGPSAQGAVPREVLGLFLSCGGRTCGKSLGETLEKANKAAHLRGGVVTDCS